MFACKNCGGNIVYDIKLQKMSCNICHSAFEPESIVKENDSIDYDYFETTEFTCPQCGAKILCEDNEATGFCSYCCSSTILTSRVTKEKKPDYIIPFTKTKEECIDEFKKITKKAIFAPRKLRDSKILDSFKAIYMPYWYYNISQVNYDFKVSAMETLSDSSVATYNYYSITGSLDAELDGVCKDASYNFSDDLSERISPFLTGEKKKFYPSYLSGFYADVADIPADIYEQEMINIANERTTEYLKKCVSKKEGDTVKIYLSNDEATKQFNSVVYPKKALFPVWFMSFKNKDKVAYMTVNGQTGFAASDLPISIPKYIIGSFICSLILFIPFLGIMFSCYELISSSFLTISLILSILVFILYYINIVILQSIDTESEDVGKFYNKYGVIYLKNGNKNYTTIMNFFDVYLRRAYIVYILFVFLIIFNIKIDKNIGLLDTLMESLIALFNIVLAFLCLVRTFRLSNTRKYFGIIITLLTQVFVFVNMLIPLFTLKAPSVTIEMIDGVVVTLGCFILFIDLVKYHNELVLRKPPHLKKRGGDEVANIFNDNK